MYGRTNGRTDGRTARRTDTTSYRSRGWRLKNESAMKKNPKSMKNAFDSITFQTAGDFHGFGSQEENVSFLDFSVFVCWRLYCLLWNIPLSSSISLRKLECPAHAHIIYIYIYIYIWRVMGLWQILRAKSLLFQQRFQSLDLSKPCPKAAR